MSWCTIESDPGVFTELISKFGVKGVQVDELYDLEPSTIGAMSPVYGLVFLFKWQKDTSNTRPVLEDGMPGVFFAKQVISNACATQAIVSILMNRPDVDLGEELSSVKKFTMDLPADMRGLAIGNSSAIRTAHNSFARPEPFVFEGKKATDDDDVYHFIGYVPVDGKVYELDGLQEGPILLGECDMDKWYEVAAPAIQERIARYSAKEIRFNLLALREKPRMRIERELANEKDATKRGELEMALKHEDEKYAAWQIENVRRKHNYIPLVFKLLQTLAAKPGKLKELVDDASKAREAREARDAKAKQDSAKKAKTESQ